MSTLVFITLVLLLFLSTPTVMLAARSSPFKAAPPVAKPARAKSHGYTTLRPRWSKKRHAFRGREIGNCLPKGFRPPPSAPSRYANYQPLGGSNACSSKPQTKPWANLKWVIGESLLWHYIHGTIGFLCWVYIASDDAWEWEWDVMW